MHLYVQAPFLECSCFRIYRYVAAPLFHLRLFPVGTGPNLVLKGMLYTLFGNNTPVNFATWMGFAMPIVLGTS